MLALIYLSLLGLLGLIPFMALPDVPPGRTHSSASQGCRSGSRWLGSPPQPSFGTPPGAQRGWPPQVPPDQPWQGRRGKARKELVKMLK